MVRKGETNPSPAEVAAEMCAGLRTAYDPLRARGAQNYFRNEIISLGIPTPALRRFVRTRVSKLRKTWTLGDAVRLCDALLREPEMDIRSAGIIALGRFRRDYTPVLLRFADRWLGRRLDNWALVDSFCGTVLAPLLETQTETEGTLIGWSGSQSLWHRRAALVSLVPSARQGHRLDLGYRLARQHFSDREDLMHKATGWLLRELGKNDRPRLRRFLVRYGPTIPRTALRYAIEHFEPRERAELLAATRARHRGGEAKDGHVA